MLASQRYSFFHFSFRCAPYQTRVTSGSQVGRKMAQNSQQWKDRSRKVRSIQFSRGTGNSYVNVQSAISDAGH